MAKVLPPKDWDEDSHQCRDTKREAYFIRISKKVTQVTWFCKVFLQVPSLNLNDSPVREGLPFSPDRAGENESFKKGIAAGAMLKSRGLTANPPLASSSASVKGILRGETHCPKASRGKLSRYSKVDCQKALVTEGLKEQVRMFASHGVV